MNAKAGLLIVVVCSGMACAGFGQGVVIDSVQEAGLLSWTNSANSNAIFRVEWASKAGGPWHSFTFQPINTIDAYGNESFSYPVPLFYRVVVMTNPPPVGMMWIDGGDVELGQTGIAEPVHTNYVSGFWIDETEVTRIQWGQVYKWAVTNGFTFESAGFGKGTNHPVYFVNWLDALKWCNARSMKDGLAPCYFADDAFTEVFKMGQPSYSNNWVNWTNGGYRLPTEAEWEKAARGARVRRLFPSGCDTISHKQANYYADTNTYAYDVSSTLQYHPSYTNGSTPFTSPRASFAPNGYGLHDMAGNVREWCWDWSESYSPDYQVDPRGPETGELRVVRGGSWNTTADGARCAARDTAFTTNVNENIGFRCVR